MDWLEVCVVTDGEGAEAVAEALRPFAHNQGVVLEQLGDMSHTDPQALETNVTVKIYVPQAEDTKEKRQKIEETLFYLGRLYPIPPPTFHYLKEQDWANAWKAHYKPFRIGNRIWIQPSWQTLDKGATTDLKDDDIILTLDPGMAFGTGLHPSTQMCLQYLEQFVKSGATVLDVGTGSGILAIAAIKLGAARVVAFDTDEVAVKTARENGTLNAVINNMVVERSSLEQQPKKKYDIVVVNILAPVIVHLLENDALLDYVTADGVIILSGIIDVQLAEVKTAVSQAGGAVVDVCSVQDWVGIVAKRSQ